MGELETKCFRLLCTTELPEEVKHSKYVFAVNAKQYRYFLSRSQLACIRMRRQIIDDVMVLKNQLICLYKIDFFYVPSRVLQFSLFTLHSSVSVVFNNFLLIHATDRIKISSDRKRLFFTVKICRSKNIFHYLSQIKKVMFKLYGFHNCTEFSRYVQICSV